MADFWLRVVVFRLLPERELSRRCQIQVAEPHVRKALLSPGCGRAGSGHFRQVPG